MRVDKSSSLSGILGEMGPAAASPASSEAAESTSFAAEVSSAAAQVASSPSPSQPAAVSGTEQPKTALASILEPSSVTASLQVVNGLMALAPSKLDSDGVPALSATSSPAVEPVSASNLIFNLVTTSNSASMAAECRLAVDAALRDIGLDPQNYKMSFWEESVGYPGGSFMNRCITVETPKGHRMDFDAALTLRMPFVTAAGLQMLDNGLWATRVEPRAEPRA